MPAGPGESLLTTLFADVHYYFSAPNTKPPHHRFDRGSYVYLFHDPATHFSKLEIANHAGTPDQDAFHGFLSAASLQYSYKQPCVISLVVDEAGKEQGEWQLPAYHVNNGQKYMYRIHTLDLYLWTEKDAATLIGHMKGLLPAESQSIRDAPASSLQKPAEHRDSMSPVVQQLEKTAIGSQFTPRAESRTSAHSLPGPPTSAMSNPTASPAPMAYNPAAPAAPEPIAHREKTPPPSEDGTGTGLGRAATQGSMPGQFGAVPNTFGGPTPGMPQPSYFTGPPGQQAPTRQSIPSFSGPPGPAQYATYAQRSPSFGPNAIASPGLPGPPPGPGTPSAPPAYTSTPLQSPGLSQQQTDPQQQQTFGYSKYSYSSSPAIPSNHGTSGQGMGYAGDVHSQLYRPTEAEANSHGHGHPKRRDTDKSQQRLMVEGKVTEVEGKVNKYLKKLDKMW